MSLKHRIFVESMVKMGRKVPEYVEPLKAITKGYLITEGIVGDIVSKVKNKFAQPELQYPEDLSKKSYRERLAVSSKVPPTPEETELMRRDRATFNEDYHAFQDAIKSLLMYICKYGQKAFVEYVTRPEFDAALARGRRLDNIRPNPLIESVEQAQSFFYLLENMAKIGYDTLAKAVYESYMITEDAMGHSVRFLAESSFSTPIHAMTREELMEEADAKKELFSHTMPCIERFIANHGVYAWNKFLGSSALKEAKKEASWIRS